LQSLTNSWIEDFYYVGPKSLLMAALLEASGKRESARLHYEAALTETRERQVGAPANIALRAIETCALLSLGRIDEARAANRVVMESVPRPYRYDPFDIWVFSPIPRCLLLGDRETALKLLREAVGAEAGTPSRRVPTADYGPSSRAALPSARRGPKTVPCARQFATCASRARRWSAFSPATNTKSRNSTATVSWSPPRARGRFAPFESRGQAPHRCHHTHFQHRRIDNTHASNKHQPPQRRQDRRPINNR